MLVTLIFPFLLFALVLMLARVERRFFPLAEEFEADAENAEAGAEHTTVGAEGRADEPGSHPTQGQQELPLWLGPRSKPLRHDPGDFGVVPRRRRPAELVVDPGARRRPLRRVRGSATGSGRRLRRLSQRARTRP